MVIPHCFEFYDIAVPQERISLEISNVVCFITFHRMNTQGKNNLFEQIITRLFPTESCQVLKIPFAPWNALLGVSNGTFVVAPLFSISIQFASFSVPRHVRGIGWRASTSVDVDPNNDNHNMHKNSEYEPRLSRGQYCKTFLVAADRSIEKRQVKMSGESLQKTKISDAVVAAQFN